MLLLVIFLILLAFVTLGLYQKSKNTMCLSKKRLEGKTAIVTGGTSGIGLQIAADLASRGARVIIACPFEKEGEEGLKFIIKKTGNEDVIFKLLDLSSIASVRKFANAINETEERLDILINNAGIVLTYDFKTKDKLNSMMQINYYGHFLLTLLLLPLLNKTGQPLEPSRIVNTTSLAHAIAKIDLERINELKQWYSLQTYANSKLCLILFSRELTKRTRGLHVVINNADPGVVVGTSIVKYRNVITSSIMSLITIIAKMFLKTPCEAAQTAIHVTLDNKAGEVSGEMFWNCQLSRASSTAYDDNLSKRLWDESVKLVGLSSEELNFL